MGKLDGKVALVTGSGRNIGRATVLKLAGEGAHVVVNARSNQAEADAVAREARDRGAKALAIIADVAKKDQVDAMVARALSEFGRIVSAAKMGLVGLARALASERHPDQQCRDPPAQALHRSDDTRLGARQGRCP
jgi:NADP-dependent 3-hydroxy acid dehydrogenase YdfG